MAIDYVIDYPCEPKRELSTEGILERIKGRERAQQIIRIYREDGDERPPSEMGFEITRSTPQGESEPSLIVVQDLLDEAAELAPLEHHCRFCPANRTGEPFGCMGFVQYPISGQAENWMLNRLPGPQEPLLWLLLKQGVEEFMYDGRQIAVLRATTDNYFEEKQAIARRMGEFDITADQVFEMVFSVGHIIPNHAAILLLFLGAMPRDDLQAGDIMGISPADGDIIKANPFVIEAAAIDDESVSQIKAFLHALYVAWSLNMRLLVDA